MIFSQKILNWYAKNKRSLPWRNTSDPYKIWLSEIILQQTRVAQGTPYYLKFIENYPTVYELANASEEQVLKSWQGLGYYSRARNLHATAKMVVEEYGGIFPNSYDSLLKLKGIGDYTASAIASICFDEPKPVVDGNVYRVLARYFGVDITTNSSAGIKYFKKLAQEVMNAENIRDYNQGIMEFGAIQCTPKKTDCAVCPLNEGCVALKENRVNMLPAKLKKAKINNRYFNYMVLIITERNGNTKTLLHQRKSKDIWLNLWEFPLYESDKEIGLKEVTSYIQKTLPFNDTPQIYQYREKIIVHKLSHQHLHTYFWIVNTTTELEGAIDLSEVENYPVPVLIADFFGTFKNSYF